MVTHEDVLNWARATAYGGVTTGSERIFARKILQLDIALELACKAISEMDAVFPDKSKQPLYKQVCDEKGYPSDCLRECWACRRDWFLEKGAQDGNS